MEASTVDSLESDHITLTRKYKKIGLSAFII